jgi:uncharacterized protein (TIGR02265 family)
MQSNSDEPQLDGKYINIMLQGNAVDKKSELLLKIYQTYQYDYHNPAVHVSYSNYLAILEEVRKALYPKLRQEEGYFELGKGMIKGYQKTDVGKILRTTGEVSTPEDLLKNVIRLVFAASRRINQNPIEELRPGYCRYRVPAMRVPPAYISGMLYGAMKIGKVKNLGVTFEEVDNNDVIFSISWEQL